MNSEKLIRVEILPQPLDDSFNETMTRAHRQKAIAEAAPELLEAVRWAAGILLDMQEAAHANRLIALAEKAERSC